MKEIIAPISKEILREELTKDKFLRRTNFGDNELYVITAHDSPNVMKEIGRLREVAFRAAGGGTGKDADIDKYDLSENPYKQLIVWDDESKEILGGYRYILLDQFKGIKREDLQLATRGLFEFSDKFIEEYLPYTIELGRSFVQPDFQVGKTSRKTLFALDNLWDGLGAIIVNYPKMKYFFGKVTMYTSYDKYARDLILFFINKYFKDTKRLVYPLESLQYFHKEEDLAKVFVNSEYKEDYKILSKEVRARNTTIPPLVNTYMNLSPTMRSFGTAINNHFGGVEETGILVTIEDIYETKKHRHMEF